MRIDVSGPGGNIYAILGIAKGAAKDIRRMGDPELADAIEAVLEQVRSQKAERALKYGEILDALANAAPWIFEFVGRNEQAEVDEEE